MPKSALDNLSHIGARIRKARLERGLSQGDIENRTGLLRCYLSRVENGHTEPSLQTLARLATALQMPLVAFFDGEEDAAAEAPPLKPEEIAFLLQIRDFAGSLSERDRQQVLGLAQKMAAAKSLPATPDAGVAPFAFGKSGARGHEIPQGGPPPENEEARPRPGWDSGAPGPVEPKRVARRSRAGSRANQ